LRFRREHEGDQGQEHQRHAVAPDNALPEADLAPLRTDLARARIDAHQLAPVTPVAAPVIML